MIHGAKTEKSVKALTYVDTLGVGFRVQYMQCLQKGRMLPSLTTTPNLCRWGLGSGHQDP